MFWDLFSFVFLLWFESVAMLVGGAILLGCSAVIGGREKERETKISKRREVGENRDDFGLYYFIM